MTDLRQNSMTGEQWVLEERSADPASTEEGERWLRTDLNSGDKIATLRVDVGSSIRDVPIFATGTAVDTVSEAMRIQVNGMTGYVPIAPVSDAAFPELRMQHNSQVHGFHDRVEPGPAIPDSGLVHDYNLLEQSVSDGGSIATLTDQAGGTNLTGNATGRTGSNGINDNQAAEYDAVDDEHTGDQANHAGQYTIHIVRDPDTLHEATVLDTGSVRVEHDSATTSDPVYTVSHSGQFSARTSTVINTSPEILSVRYGDTYSSTPDFAVNGTDLSLNDGGGISTPSGEMSIGNGSAGFYDGLFGRALIYDQEQSDADWNDTIDAIASEWGITL